MSDFDSKKVVKFDLLAPEELKNKNWIKWKLMPIWSLREAAYLICGFIPDKYDVSISEIESYEYNNLKISDIHEILNRAKEIGEIKIKDRPETYIRWAIANGIKCHKLCEDFVQEVANRSRIDGNEENNKPGSSKRIGSLYIIVYALSACALDNDKNDIDDNAKQIESMIASLGINKITKNTVKAILKDATSYIKEKGLIKKNSAPF